MGEGSSRAEVGGGGSSSSSRQQISAASGVPGEQGNGSVMGAAACRLAAAGAASDPATAVPSVPHPGYMSRNIQKFRTDKLDT